MSDQGPFPGQPPQPPYGSGDQPQQPAPRQEAERPAPTTASPHVYGQPATSGETPPPKRRQGWIWAAVGVVTLVVVACACIAPFAMFMSDDLSFSSYDSVAVIPIDGIIAGTGDYYSGYITPQYLRDQLAQAESDPSVRAIVLRVNSPGGTVAASQELTRYIDDCELPVVVSIGDVGASGAYMLASHADEIWAMPGSTVGSIGVITEIPNVAGLLDRLGVEFQVITSGEYKDAGSPWREMTDEERAMIQGELDEVYDQFIDTVAEGRPLDREDVEKLATGWAWSGERALELGLIDELGTYDDALDAAARLGGIEGDDYNVITFDDPFSSLFSGLFRLSYRLESVLATWERAQVITGPAIPR
jgi:protease IV